jgi:uncharacterized protein YdiU (UPF0061 family)
VPVRPTPLPDPVVAAYSPEVAAMVGLSEEACASEAFARFFGADQSAVPGMDTSWATPYALSIFGSEMYDNCPFKTGNGYGDGRACSIAEVVVDGRRWELQLKGSGTTPFSRGGDGRAVVRSSVRKFLASEAMGHMGVSTTRALACVVSKSETCRRPWYSDQKRNVPTTLEELAPAFAKSPQVANLPPESKRQLLRQLQAREQQPDIMQIEPCAVVCRVAPSFLRVGHVELHSRRARTKERGSDEFDALRAMLDHAVFREYPDLAPLSTEERAVAIVKAFSERGGDLVADWLRVGYTQGNFNSDNCLVGGRTMDYGPFGFIEQFYPTWNMWHSGGEHFSFMAQPTAMARNIQTFSEALLPLVKGTPQEAELNAAISAIPAVVRERCDAMWQRKLGVTVEAWGRDRNAPGRRLLDEAFVLLEKGGGDWTVFWRQLAKVADGAGIDALRPAFADWDPNAWTKWGEAYRECVAPGGGEAMRRISPKYVPREWMLTEAYAAANSGDYSKVHFFQDLFRKPFDEQPEMEERYYRRTPDFAQGKPGVAYMS